MSLKCCKYGLVPTNSPTPRRLIRTGAGYRWKAGTSGRRKRDNLLDNVDPADPETSDARRPEEPDRKRSPAGDSSASTSANGWAADSQRKTEGPATEPGTSAWANGTFAADENGWAGPPKPEAEDWGWGTDRGRSGQSRKAKDSSRGVWPDSNGADNDNASGDATPAADAAQGDAWEEGPWDEDDGPDIVELRPEEVALMLPATPTAEQIQYCSGDSSVLWQRLGVSLLATLVTLKVSALAAGSLTFPLWYPSLQAALRNRNVRGKFRHVGLWRAAVVDLEVEVRVEPRFRERRGARPLGGPQARVLRLLVGDASGARSELSVPYQQRYDAIRVGEPAEVLVLSRFRTFQTFKALKELYLPECGVWVSDYPFLNREAFLDVSLEIERERQQEMAESL